MGEAGLNKSTWFYRLSALAIALLCVAVVLRSCAAMQQIDVATGDIPLLRGKAALREALPGDPRLYRLMDMALTGQPVADPLTLTAQDCLYVGYEAERFEEVLNDAPDMVRTWSRTWVRCATTPPWCPRARRQRCWPWWAAARCALLPCMRKARPPCSSRVTRATSAAPPQAAKQGCRSYACASACLWRFSFG